MLKKLKFIPNLLSIIRLLLVGVFVALFFTDYPRNLTYAMIVFVIAGATDVADGFLARHFNWESNVGRLLDPLADKTMQCTVLVCLLIKRIIPVWFAVSYLIKEVAMMTGGVIILKKKDIVVKSRWYGKAVCVLFYAVIVIISLIIILSGENVGDARPIIYTLCTVTLALTVAAMVTYFISYVINPQNRIYTNVPDKKE